MKISDFERPDFTRYLASKASGSWTKRTKEQHIKIVCIFANWLCDNHITSKHQRFKQTKKPIQRDMPESFEIELLFNALKENFQFGTLKQKLMNHQRYLVARILYETGCRISEAVSLYCEDVRIQSGKYFILIRGTKSDSAERCVQISTELFTELNQYRNLYEIEERLFSAKNGFAIETQNYTNWLKTFSSRLGISCKITPHVFRYMFIIESIKNGGDLTEIMVRLGHSSVQMTIYYFNQVRRLYPDIALSNSISILEQKRRLDAYIFNKQTKLGGQ